MEPDQWYIDGCVRVNRDEQYLYEEWTRHLPVREESTPYHSGPHSIRNFQCALAIAGLSKSFQVLEVGFCLGHSAEIFYRLGASTVISIEISDRIQTKEAGKTMIHRHPTFELVTPKEYESLGGYKPNLGFIDGDHSAAAIRNDVAIMRGRRVPWVLFDDFWPHWGDTQQVMKELGITPVAILGTMALCDFR